MFIVIVVINALASRAKTRIDLTEERAYTLSPGTACDPREARYADQIRFYCTRQRHLDAVQLKTYAQRVEDLLGEYRQASKGQIEIQKLDPVPDSDAEDSAKLDGVEGQQIRLDGEPIYLGLSVSMLDQKEAIPFLTPDRERLLEYDISRAISRVMSSDKPVVGVMSPLPLAGRQMNPMMMQMGQRGQQPWVFYSELGRDFTVKQVEMTADKIPDEVKVLVLIHPKGITDTAQWAIDQFVLRGGKLIAFLDPAERTRSKRRLARWGMGAGQQLEPRETAQGLGSQLRQHESRGRHRLRAPHAPGPAACGARADRKGR
jgi:ABC-type uncharacterized transport system involved in gliding motility auxiliary subunit